MAFAFTNYNKSYTEGAARMMGKTWNIDKNFPGIKDKQYLYALFFEVCHLASDYCDIIVNEKNEVVGFLMASPTKYKFNLKFLSLITKILWATLSGKFGNPLQAMKMGDAYAAAIKELMEKRSNYDQEINLFFIDESARGHGLGKKLMDRYITYCHKNDFKRIILITDAGCNYGFYDHYGFKRLKQIHSNIFPQPNLPFNGFSYGYTLNGRAH